MEGVWIIPELNYTVDKGYKVLAVDEVGHWERERAGLFAEYINKFLKIQMEASGWGSYNTEQKKRDYVAKIF